MNKNNGRVAKGIVIAGVLIAVIFYFTRQTPVIIAVEAVIGSFLFVIGLTKYFHTVPKG